MRSSSRLGALAFAVLASATILGKSPTGMASPTRLYPLPASGRAVCRAAQEQTRHVVLCPRRLPRPTRGWPIRSKLPSLRGEVLRNGREILGVELAYGAPVEPASGPARWVEDHLWLNRPCCALHFVVLRVTPATGRRLRAIRLRLGGRRGLLAEAAGYAPYGRSGPTGIYWRNHTWFFWREREQTYGASVHYFGRRPTRNLLDRLMRELVPARTLTPR